jgi:DNA-binding IclR family transcriptional regulator
MLYTWALPFVAVMACFCLSYASALATNQQIRFLTRLTRKGYIKRKEMEGKYLLYIIAIMLLSSET